MIKCNVSNVAIEITETETLTAGRVGLECQFTFSSEWDGLAITAYFLGSTTKAVVVNGDTVTVPAESMAEPGYKLYVGVVGKNAQGNIVIPTLWASAGKIKRSPGEEEEATPSPDVVAQIQLMAINAVNTANAAMQVITDHYEEIEEVGTEQVAAVNAAGTTQTGNVNTAGTTQINAIAAKGEEVLDSIPEDYTALSDDVDDLKSALSEVQMGGIPYGGAGTISGRLTVTQNKNTLILNGTSVATSGQANTKISLTNPFNAWNGTTTPDKNFAYPINLVSGHIYKLTATVISGTRLSGEGTGAIQIKIISEEETELASAWLGIDNDCASFEVIGDGSSVRMLCLVARLIEVSDLTIRIELADITEENSAFIEFELPLELGGISAYTGQLLDNNIRLRNNLGLPSFVDKIVADADYSFTLIGCKFSQSRYLGSWNGHEWTGSGSAAAIKFVELNKITEPADYYLIMLRRVDNEEITIAEASHVHFFCRNVSKFAGLKYAALGDSITYGFVPRNTFGYPGQLKSFANLAAMNLGMTFDNYGISGSTLAYHSSRDPMSRRFNDLPDDSDIITVMGGTNDIRNGIQLGTMADRTDATFYGALHVVLGGLYKKYMIDQGTTIGRKKHIVVLTPIKLLDDSATEQGGTGTLVNFEPWINAVKEVAAYYSLPCLDFYSLSGINPHLNETVKGTESGYTGYYNPYITDGTHPTREGAAIMADVLCGFLETIM